MIRLNENNILKALILADLSVLALYLLTNHIIPIPSWTLRHWFDMDAESNIPTWFSSIQLLFIALTCAACSITHDDRRLRRFYALAAAGFAFLSADEVAQIHEGVGRIAKKTHVAREYFPDLPQLWMFVYPIAALLVALAFRQEIYAFLCEKKGSLIFFGGASVYISGTLGFEAIDLYLIAVDEQILDTVEICFEETFELLGQSIMLYAFLRISHRWAAIKYKFPNAQRVATDYEAEP